MITPTKAKWLPEKQDITNNQNRQSNVVCTVLLFNITSQPGILSNTYILNAYTNHVTSKVT